jgi:NADH-quinone oxidoreductase subunit H
VSTVATILGELTPAYWQSTLLRVVIIGILVPTGALILAIVFLFKVMAWMQSRLGPYEAGPKGLLQLVAEVGKWLQKEDLVPHGADRIVFKAAPFVILASTFVLYAAIPSGPDPAFAANVPTGIYFVLAVSALSVIGVLMAGWASSNKYALIGGIRAAGQLIAYELPMVLAAVGVVILARSLNLQDIVTAQANFRAFGDWGIALPFVVVQLPLFVVFMSAVQAELTQAPFDMPIAESEIVSGYQVEYSGFRFLVFFLAEFATAFGFAAIVSTLFLGGWYLPLPFIGDDLTSGWWYVLGPIILFTKVMIVSFIVFWVRFTYPRFREDQLQKFAWKWLIPISLAWITVTSVAVVVWQ